MSPPTDEEMEVNVATIGANLLNACPPGVGFLLVLINHGGAGEDAGTVYVATSEDDLTDVLAATAAVVTKRARPLPGTEN